MLRDRLVTLSKDMGLAPLLGIQYILFFLQYYSAVPMAACLMLSPPTLISLKPAPATYIPLLEKCSSIEEAKQIHAQMIKTGLVHQTIPASKFLTTLCKISAVKGIGLTYSLQFFDRIQEPNTFMWNTIIRVSSNSQNQEDSIVLYCQMLCDGAPQNLYTFPFLVKACNLDEIHQLHCHVIKFGFALELHTANALLHAYAKSGCTESAGLLFDRMQHRDAVSWNSVLDGYAKNGQIEMARRIFDQMREKNVISWTVMINGYVENCLFKEALDLFQEMQARGVEPDKVALACTLSACAQLGALDQGRWIDTYIRRKRIQLDTILSCVLVDMYAKCGALSEAVTVFEKREDRICVSLWTAMITGFAVHGKGREALNLFEEMEGEGIRPNEITFTGVLRACSYSGLVEEGKTLFMKMVQCYKIRPSIEHYGCLVDLLGRAGLLNEAEQLIAAMPMKPSAVVWGALLTACRIHRDYDRAMRVGKILIQLEPDHAGRYIYLANIFAAKGEWKRAAMVRKMMKKREVSKLPGSSLISVNGTAHEFYAGDRSHPERETIYAEWSKTLARLKQEGYVPETKDLPLDLEEEERNCSPFP